MTGRPPSQDYIGRLAGWGRDVALPQWAEWSWDARKGGFFEHLGAGGDGLYGDVRRVRVQARQSYVFARAHVEGWLSRLDLAEAGYALMAERACETGGRPGWAHTLDDAGRVLDDRRDLYDHAFIILASVWMHRATGDRHYLDMAYRTLAFLDAEMALEVGGYREAIGAPELPRRQNPHMHLFEAFLPFYETTGDPVVKERLVQIKTLFDHAFFDPEDMLLREYFEADWSPRRKDGGRVEPGHLCEWVWLLSEYERLVGGDGDETRRALFSSAVEKGMNPATGLLYAAIDSRGGVLDAGSRTWMQTEWVRAAAVHCLQSAGAGSAPLNVACRSLWERHIGPATPGGWVDVIGSDGMIADHRIPMSTAYHILGSVLEADRFLQAAG